MDTGLSKCVGWIKALFRLRNKRRKIVCSADCDINTISKRDVPGEGTSGSFEVDKIVTVEGGVQFKVQNKSGPSLNETDVIKVKEYAPDKVMLRDENASKLSVRTLILFTIEYFLLYVLSFCRTHYLKK